KTEEERRSADGGTFERDVLFFRALEILIATDRASTSLLQRHLKIGYSRAAGILDTMEREGLIGAMDRSTKAREILPKARELARDIADGALGDEQG
ncbi:MAG: DNA translocase FtsK, partial [Acidobacteriota bacterium]